MDLPYPSKGNSYPEASLTVELMFSLCVMATGRVVENLIDSDGTCLISALVLLSIPSLVRLKLVERSRIPDFDDARVGMWSWWGCRASETTLEASELYY